MEIKISGIRDYTEAKWCVILNSETLEEVRVVTFPNDQTSYTIQDAKLYGSGQHLYIRNNSNDHLFLDLETMESEWQIEDDNNQKYNI